jgi:hypothetical protein
MSRARPPADPWLIPLRGIPRGPFGDEKTCFSAEKLLFWGKNLPKRSFFAGKKRGFRRKKRLTFGVESASHSARDDSARQSQNRPWTNSAGSPTVGRGDPIMARFLAWYYLWKEALVFNSDWIGM